MFVLVKIRVFFLLLLFVVVFSLFIFRWLLFSLLLLLLLLLAIVVVAASVAVLAIVLLFFVSSFSLSSPYHCFGICLFVVVVYVTNIALGLRKLSRMTGKHHHIYTLVLKDYDSTCY